MRWAGYAGRRQPDSLAQFRSLAMTKPDDAHRG